MKKLLTIGFTGILAVAALAVESDPSNTVGFISQTLGTGFSTFSACPIGLAADAPAADYIAGQGIPGDVIYKHNGTAWSGYAWTADWTGLTFDYNSAFLFKNNSGAAESLVIAGDVIPVGTDLAMGTFASGTYAAWGNPLPMDIDLDVDDCTLAADGFASGDKIFKHNGTAWSGYMYNGTTYGGLVLDAGETFLVKIDGAHADVSWDYLVGGAAVATANVSKVVKSSNSLR
jgi:hypothetical protein